MMLIIVSLCYLVFVSFDLSLIELCGKTLKDFEPGDIVLLTLKEIFLAYFTSKYIISIFDWMDENL